MIKAFAFTNWSSSLVLTFCRGWAGGEPGNKTGV